MGHSMMSAKNRAFQRSALLLVALACITVESRSQILRLDTVPKDGAGAAPESVGRALVTTESKSQRAVTRSLVTNAPKASDELWAWAETRRDETVSEIQGEGHSTNSEQKTARGRPGVQKLHVSSGLRSAMTTVKDATGALYAGEEIASARAGATRSSSTMGETAAASPTGSLTADAHMLRRVGQYFVAFRLTVQNTTGDIASFPVIEVTLPKELKYLGLTRAPEFTLTAIDDASARNRLNIHMPFSLLPGELAEVTLQTRSDHIAIDPKIHVRAYSLEAE